MSAAQRIREARLALAGRTAALAVLPPPEDALIAEETRAGVWEVLRVLPPREGLCVTLRWFADATYRQIGARLGVCAQRAREINNRALNMLTLRVSR